MYARGRLRVRPLDSLVSKAILIQNEGGLTDPAMQLRELVHNIPNLTVNRHARLVLHSPAFATLNLHKRIDIPQRDIEKLDSREQVRIVRLWRNVQCPDISVDSRERRTFGVFFL